MNKKLSSLYNSTAPIGLPRQNESHQAVRLPQEVSGSIIGIHFIGGKDGIRSVSHHRAPPLSEKMISEFNADQPEYITRHFEARFLTSNLKGYFRFRPIVEYRAEEGAQLGRLGDHEESRVKEVFKTRYGYIKEAQLESRLIQDVLISESEHEIVAETIVNDYCSCSSIGVFSLSRGNAIRSREANDEKKVGAYVTYHLPSLIKALQNHSATDPRWSNLVLLGKKVEYGQKDKFWQVEDTFSFQRDRDAFALWQRIAFVKSRSFIHEEEFRLLLVDPSGPGGLPAEANSDPIKMSESIASCIVDHGVFAPDPE